MTDLSAYFSRVGYTGAPEPTLEALHALVAAHNGAIPFENLDPLMGTPVADLGQAALADKLVHRRRGGYCYEQNGLMGYVLAEMGFGVDRLAGRVVWMSTSEELPAQTHEALSVTVPGVDGPWLVDVGFGGPTLSSPIRLEVGPVQQTRHEPYRCVSTVTSFCSRPRSAASGNPFTRSTRACAHRSTGKSEVGMCQRIPIRIFVTGLMVALVTDDARWNMRGRNLAIHSGGGTERIRFDTAADVLVALTERFGIDVADAGPLSDVEARVNAVLDS